MIIFEQLKEQLGCDYISDLKFYPYSSKAKALLKIWDLNAYSLAELNDIASYLYSAVPFESKKDAIFFLNTKQNNTGGQV